MTTKQRAEGTLRRPKDGISAHLQQQQNFRIFLVQSDVESGLAKFAEGIDVRPTFEKQLDNVSMVVFGGPVQSGHLQHVLGVHVSAVLDRETPPSGSGPFGGGRRKERQKPRHVYESYKEKRKATRSACLP